MTRWLLRLNLLIAVISCLLLGVWYWIIGETIETAPSVAATLDSPWQLQGGSTHPGAIIYRGCASCHLSDGLGRRDGTVPQIAGQQSKILIGKLNNIRLGKAYLPVMQPFANALGDEEITLVADYISQLPTLLPRRAENNDYHSFCASCHGPEAEGNIALLAPALCHQQYTYMQRRIKEIRSNKRGDADTGMMAVIRAIPEASINTILKDLSEGRCLPAMHGGKS